MTIHLQTKIYKQTYDSYTHTHTHTHTHKRTKYRSSPKYIHNIYLNTIHTTSHAYYYEIYIYQSIR